MQTMCNKKKRRLLSTNNTTGNLTIRYREHRPIDSNRIQRENWIDFSSDLLYLF